VESGRYGLTTMRTLFTIIIAALAPVAMLALAPSAFASGRAACPGAVAGPGWGKNEGVIATKATDMGGDVYAQGATRCTIKFHERHKSAPYCKVSGPELEHIIARVAKVSRTEVTFSFSAPLTEEPFTYECMFRD
jgi:hypothetical protein